LNCHDIQNLIDGYMDGGLDLVRNLEIEQHLQGCSTCMQIYKNRQALRTAIQTNSLYQKAPVHLQKRIQASLRQGNQPRSILHMTPLRLLSVAAALLIAAIITWSLINSLSVPSVNEPLVQAVLSSHIRSLMANHLVDVPSSDKHTVKPWFDGKLDYSPPVVDLAQQGFPLVGGRLDYLNDRPVAALVYKRRNHFINLFIWPSTSAPVSNGNMTTLTRQGYYLITWTRSGMTYWAVSDLEESELQQFVQLVQHQITSAPSTLPHNLSPPSLLMVPIYKVVSWF
jgi:anti-sigma factor RsiW